MVAYLAIEIGWESGDYADPPYIEKISLFKTLDEAHEITHHIIKIEIPEAENVIYEQIKYRW